MPLFLDCYSVLLLKLVVTSWNGKQQCCGSVMFIPVPGFLIPDPGSRIPDPKTATKEKGKKISCPTFFCSQKCHKIKNGFGIRDPGILDPGSRGQKVTGSQIPDPDPQHW